VRNGRGDPWRTVSDVLVLCYHALSETWPAELSSTPERFEQQLELVLGHGYRGSTFTDAVTSAADGKTLAITFDDGFRSVVKLALPILRRLELPATIFVPTSFVGAGGPMAWPRIDRWLGGLHEDELLPVTWEDLAALADEGWEIGSHTRSHPRLTQLDDRALAAELRESRHMCEERLGLPCRAVAYPYGDVDERVVRAARAAGYAAGAALPIRMHPPIPLRWPRVGVWHADTLPRFWAKASRRRRRIAALPGGEALLYAERKGRYAVRALRGARRA
jgi:peptidoglycan/xylan/chitin deacetylase (PgdA/CDA1 family)